MREQPALAREETTPIVSGVAPDPVHADNAVTWHDDRNGIATTGVADGTRTAVEVACQFPVGAGLARGNLQQLLPDPPLEGRTGDGQRYAEAPGGIAEITLEFPCHAFAGSRSGRFRYHEPRHEIHAHHAILLQLHTDSSDGCVQDHVMAMAGNGRARHDHGVCRHTGLPRFT